MSGLLSGLGLTSAQRAERRGVIGGSDANTIMGGDPEKLLRLWEEKTGKREPDDLSHILPVMMGHATEEFNAAWYEKVSCDSVTARNDRLRHESIEFMAANIDGICLGGSAVFEAKHVGGFESDETVVQRYMPQLHHNMLVAGRSLAVLSVLIGNSRHEHFRIEIDPFYADGLLESEARFWACVTGDTPPVDLPRPMEAPPFDKMRIVDMNGNNAFAAHAADYLQNKSAAARFETAKTELKKLVDSDVRQAFGYGVTITRDKRGALRFKED